MKYFEDAVYTQILLYTVQTIHRIVHIILRILLYLLRRF